MPVEEFPHRRSHNRDGAFFAQSFNHFIERPVRRLCKHTENEIPMRIEHGTPWLALFGRADIAVARFSRAHVPAVATPIPNRPAACRVDIPPSIAATARSRKSML